MKYKNFRFNATFVLIFFAFAFTDFAHARVSPIHDFENHLARMQAREEIDAAKADLFRLFSVAAPHRLPLPLQSKPQKNQSLLRRGDAEQPKSSALRCGFPTFRSVRERLSLMPPEIRIQAEEYLYPTRISGSARTANMQGWIFHLAHTLETDHFLIEWGDQITNEDGSRSPLWDDDGDNIPNAVELWAEYFETSFHEIVETMGFAPSAIAPGSGGKVQVFIGNSDPSTTIDDISISTYGTTNAITGGIPYLTVNNDFYDFPPNMEGETRLDWIHGAMKVTAAHEFFHVIHYLWEPYGWSVEEDDWWYEASATWMEDEVYDGVNDYFNYYNDNEWADSVEEGLPINFFYGNPGLRPYGAAIFVKYLSEHVGGRQSVRDVWDFIRPPSSRRILEALDLYAANYMGFENLEEMYMGFAVANATMDYEEGGKYGAVPLRNPLLGKPSLTKNNVTDNLPAYLGSTYFSESGLAGDITVELTAYPSHSWGLSLAVQKANGDVLALGKIDQQGNSSVSIASLEADDNVIAAVSYLYSTGSSNRFSTSTAHAFDVDISPPKNPSTVQAAPQPGGFDLSWKAPTDDAAAGHVVRWEDDHGGIGRRTIFGPSINFAEVRGLTAGNYYVSLYAYDQAGNIGEEIYANAQSQIIVKAAAEPAPPDFDSFVFHTPRGGGGGGSGGGCFLNQLGLFETTR